MLRQHQQEEQQKQHLQRQARSPNRCWGCGKNGPDFPVCSRCKKVRYCSTECQVLDYPYHRNICTTDNVEALEAPARHAMLMTYMDFLTPETVVSILLSDIYKGDKEELMRTANNRCFHISFSYNHRKKRVLFHRVRGDRETNTIHPAEFEEKGSADEPDFAAEAWDKWGYKIPMEEPPPEDCVRLRCYYDLLDYALFWPACLRMKSREIKVITISKSDLGAIVPKTAKEVEQDFLLRRLPPTPELEAIRQVLLKWEHLLWSSAHPSDILTPMAFDTWEEFKEQPPRSKVIVRIKQAGESIVPTERPTLAPMNANETAYWKYQNENEMFPVVHYVEFILEGIEHDFFAFRPCLTPFNHPFYWRPYEVENFEDIAEKLAAYNVKKIDYSKRMMCPCGCGTVSYEPHMEDGHYKVYGKYGYGGDPSENRKKNGKKGKKHRKRG